MKVTVVTILLWIGLSIGISISAAWALLNSHGALPHKDALHKEWFQQHLAQEEEWRQIHTDAIKSLHQDMKALLERLIDK